MVQNLQGAIQTAQAQLNSLEGLDLSAEEQVAIAEGHMETLQKYRRLREDIGKMGVWRKVAAAGKLEDAMEE